MAAKRSKTYELKVTLRGPEPPAWRTLLVAGKTGLGELHDIIRIAMGREDEGLHYFRKGKQEYLPADIMEVAPLPYLFGDARCSQRNEEDHTVAEVLPRKRSNMLYVHCEDDEWRHEVRVERTMQRKPDMETPRCIAGADGAFPAPVPFDLEEVNRRLASCVPGEDTPMTRDELRGILREVEIEDLDEATMAFAEVCERMEHGGRDLVWLVAYDLDPVISRNATLLMITGLDGNRADATAPLGANGDFTAEVRAMTLSALRDPKVPDERKELLLGVAHAISLDIDRGELRTMFKDFDGIREKARRQMCAHIADSAADVENLLVMLKIAPQQTEDNKDEFRRPEAETVYRGAMAALDFLQEKPRFTLTAFSCIAAAAGEHGLDPEPLLALLPDIEPVVSADNAWSLWALSSWPGLGALGAGVRDILERNGLAGDTPPRLHFDREFSSAVATCVDGNGSRSLSLSYRTPEGGMDSINFLLNEQIGVKDIWCVYEEGDQVREKFKRAKHGVKFIPCSLDFSRELVAHAMQVHLNAGRNLPWKVFLVLPYLGATPPRPRRRRPNLGAYMLETMRRRPALVNGSQKLMGQIPYKQFWFCGDHLYAYLSKHHPRAGLEQKLKPKDFEAFLRQITPADIADLTEKLAVNLEIEALAGRAKQKYNQISARTYVALKENLVAPAEVPYVRALAEQSVTVILYNLAQGHKNQEEANRAALELDEVMDDIIAGEMRVEERSQAMDHAMEIIGVDDKVLGMLGMSREDVKRELSELFFNQYDEEE